MKMIINLLLLSNLCNAQTYIIDNLKVLSEEKVYFDKDINLKIIHKDNTIKFYKSELDSSISVNRDVLYQTYITTNSRFFKERVRFICWDKSYELQFMEISDREIKEKFIGFTKIYHIKAIYK